MSSTDSTDKMNVELKKTMLVPDFLSSRPEGVFINLPNLSSAANFVIFIDRLFSGFSRFTELNYDFFLKLLYDADWLEQMQAKSPEIKIASGIVHFPPHRQELYRTVKVLERGKHAEYVFEPVHIEVTYEKPVYGEPGADGIAPIVKHEKIVEQQAAVLDFDEFVAVMWGKGVKYGILAEDVRKVITDHSSTRMIIARHLEPTAGSDAGIQEVCADLHRDNSPKTLLNGKTDLRAFQNRFPQITKGARLLKKIKRVLGKHGYWVTGEMIEPVIPKDLNLLALTSLGTAIVQDKGEDYIVAVMDGFLTIDTSSNLISISEKIETTAGISMKTTGDLMLGVEEFVEHGEVQEGRVVKGKHMTFKSNVFGHLLSSGGNIVVVGNLTGGGAETTGGDITLARASRAVIRTNDGVITAKYIENCTVIGNTLNIEQAVNCELIAIEIHATSVEGCMIAAENVNILKTNESRNRETTITMLIPDLSTFEKCISKLETKIAECSNAITSKHLEIEKLISDQEFAKFMTLHDKIKSGAIKLTSDQAANWQKLMMKNSTIFNQAEKLKKQISDLEQLILEHNAELAMTLQNKDATGAGINCMVDTVIGQTTGQTLKSVLGIKVFHKMTSDDIKTLLQKADPMMERIFSEDDGSINWQYK